MRRSIIEKSGIGMELNAAVIPNNVKITRGDEAVLAVELRGDLLIDDGSGQSISASFESWVKWPP